MTRLAQLAGLMVLHVLVAGLRVCVELIDAMLDDGAERMR